MTRIKFVQEDTYVLWLFFGFFFNFYFLWLCCMYIYRKQGKFQTACHTIVLRTAVLLILKKRSLKFFFYKINVNSKCVVVKFLSSMFQ